MERQAVKSQAILSVGYDQYTSDMEVQMTDGKVITYHGVPDYVWSGFMTTLSMGHYFNTQIRDRYSHD